MDRNRVESSPTFILGGMPSFTSGVSSVLDFADAATSYNTSRNGKAADTKAIRSDWQAVGSDIKHAMKEYEKLSK